MVEALAGLSFRYCLLLVPWQVGMETTGGQYVAGIQERCPKEQVGSSFVRVAQNGVSFFHAFAELT